MQNEPLCGIYAIIDAFFKGCFNSLGILWNRFYGSYCFPLCTCVGSGSGSATPAKLCGWYLETSARLCCSIECCAPFWALINHPADVIGIYVSFVLDLFGRGCSSCCTPWLECVSNCCLYSVNIKIVGGWLVNTIGKLWGWCCLFV